MERLFYLGKVFDGLNTMFEAFMVLCAISFSILLLITIVSYVQDGPEDKDHLAIKKWTKIIFAVLCFNILGFIFTPDKETYLFMFGGKVVDSTIEANPEIKELPGNTLNLLNEYIQAETDKIKGKKPQPKEE